MRSSLWKNFKSDVYIKKSYIKAPEIDNLIFQIEASLSIMKKICRTKLCQAKIAHEIVAKFKTIIKTK